MMIFEVDLIPISLIADDGGPTKMTPSFWHCSANSTFSERNPYPGWIACAPVNLATSRILSPLRYDCPEAGGDKILEVAKLTG